TPHPPILFDHTTDHIPGMVLLEAAHQATTAHTHPTTLHPTTLHATFHHYTEHHTPTYITAHTSNNDNGQTPTPTTHITAHQNNTTVFTAQLTTHTPTTT
ncbi:AfsA-related hotdog domain-containing protein, partial [Streptomyces sp. NPDC059340]|uniref:AfsA-related hotdog domain-containing protein n=1 Tax=Streptomyces sp. NPDC059340 TaxID=3346806 RepID=UPI003674E039